MKISRFTHPMIILIGIALISLSLCIELPPFHSVSDLPYQAHSFNDVGYIRQLLKRGTKYFKIDVSLANRQSCQKNSNWNSSNPCYKTYQYAQEYCCLALRGDTSGRNNFEYPFSTLDEFVQLVQDHVISRGIDKILFFAINFQFNFQFSNILVENNMLKLAKLMEKYPKLHFGTGSDDFILQYDRICKNALQAQSIQVQPLQKLNQQACTQNRKYISSSRFFLQSGSNDPSDPRDIHGRFRNFNVYYKAIVDRCANGFPAWVKKYPDYPLIFWEPSDEKQIQMVLELFMSEECRHRHGRDLTGLAITSNIDPEVFEFYLKKVNPSVSTSPLAYYPKNEKVPLQYANNFISKLGNYILLGQQNSVSDQSKGTSLELRVLSQDFNTGQVLQIAGKNMEPSKGTIKVVGGKQNMVVVQKPLDSDESNLALLTLLSPTLQKLIQPSEIQGFVDVSFFDGNYYVLRRTGNPTFFNVLKTTDLNKTSMVLSFGLVPQKALSIESFLVFQDSNGTVRYLISGSIEKQVWIGQVRRDNLYKSKMIGFGVKSKLILKENGMIVVTIENGQCNSGVQINNGDMPACETYKFPQLKAMTSTTSTVTIIQSTFNNLINFMQSETIAPVTPCTEGFVHSKAFNGRNVHMVDIWNQLFFVTEFVHLSQQGMLNALFCAPSNFQWLQGGKKGMLGTISSRNDVGLDWQKNIQQSKTKKMMAEQ